MDDGKTYDDKEMSLIIRKAAELQRTAAPEKHLQTGFSLAELEAAGQEAGIDPAFIRQAAGLVNGAPALRVNPWLGAALAAEAKAAFPEAFDDDRLEEALAALPELAECDGDGRVHNGRLSWSVNPLHAYNSGKMIRVTVEPSGDGSGLTVKWDLKQLAGGLIAGITAGLGGGVGMGVGMGVGLGALNSPLFAVLFSTGAIAGSYLLSRGIFILVARRAGRAVERIRDGLAALLAKPAAPRPPRARDSAGA